MSMPWRPSVDYGTGAGTLLEWSLPQLPWVYGVSGVGGHAVSASGVPESYEIREDRTARVTLRVRESELDATLLFLSYQRKNASVPMFWRFDRDEPSTEREVYLVSPTWEDGDVAPRRDPAFVGVYLLDLTIRTVDGSAFGVEWLEGV